jgi:hypothetical protein
MSVGENPRPKIERPHKGYRFWSLTTDVLALAIEANWGRSGKPGLFRLSGVDHAAPSPDRRFQTEADDH